MNAGAEQQTAVERIQPEQVLDVLDSRYLNGAASPAPAKFPLPLAPALPTAG